MFKTHSILAIASLTLLGACSTLQWDKNASADAKLLITASRDCDRSNDPALSSLNGIYPLSVYQRTARPSLSQLTQHTVPNEEQKKSIYQYSELSVKCNAEINYVVEKYFSPGFAKAWRNYNFQLSEIDRKLISNNATFGEAASVRYASAVALKNELSEYRFNYGPNPNINGENFKTLETCNRNYQSKDMPALLTLLLNEQSRLITGNVICEDNGPYSEYLNTNDPS